LSSAPPSAVAAASGSPSLRFGLPVGLLVAESLVLSLLADFPASGPALRLASAARILIPSAMGAGAAGWILARGELGAAARSAAASLPPWRPATALLAHLATFALTASLARVLLGPGAPPIGAGAFLQWSACAALTALTAVATAAPLGWLVRFASRHLRVPLLAMATGILAWRAAVAAEGLWGVLGMWTVRAVGALLRVARPDAVVIPEESIVGAGGFEVIIAPVCSGADGLGLVLVFQALWFSLARSRIRFDRAALLVPAGLLAWFFANVARIAALVLVGASGRQDLAHGAFHSRLGWLLFAAIALGTIAVGEHVRWFRRGGEADRRDDEGVPSRTVAYVGPLIAALATALVTGLWTSSSLDGWYALRVLAAALALLAVRKDLPRPTWSFSAIPIFIGAAVCAAWVVWPHGDGSALRTEVERLAPGARSAWIAARLGGACLVVPIVEELAFRGFLLPWFVRADFEAAPPRAWTWSAVALSSLAFGAIHQHVALGALAGAAFAVARLWRGRLGDAVVAHALANAGLAALVLLGGRWDLWS
jgi:exosortase E/protease (VPEID-CTERM system)